MSTNDKENDGIDDADTSDNIDGGLEDGSPTIQEGVGSFGRDSTDGPDEADLDDDDCAPTIMEKPQSEEGSSNTGDAEEFDPDDDDFAPTIMEKPGNQPPLSETEVSVPTETPSDDYDPDDDDFAPTIMEKPAGVADSSRDLSIDDDDDFAPTLLEKPSAGPASDSTDSDNEYGEFESGDDFAPTLLERPSGDSPSKSTIKKGFDGAASSSGFSITQTLQVGKGGLRSGDPNFDAKEEIQVQKYTIGERIAEGGMGAILGATDLNIKRDVAMKVLLEARLDSSDNVIRFIEEAQVTGQLEHPSIVPVYELGFNDTGEVYYSMKYVRGVTLKDVLKQIRKGDAETIEKYPLARLLTIFQKVCDAMAFAHSKGVVHRDLKPENIMIGDFGEVLVMDWGLAKILELDGSTALTTIRRADAGDVFSHLDRGSDSTTGDQSSVDLSASVSRGAVDSLMSDFDGESLNTMDGQIMGTPNFMAPEQATAQNEKIKLPSDIYALGGILYNILTLRVPITGKSLTEMMVDIVRGKITPPVSYNLPKKAKAKEKDDSGPVIEFHHCPGGKIPEALSAVSMKALALKPEDRYPDVEALQADIEAYQGGFATSAEEAGLVKLVILMIKRHKMLSAVSLISFLIFTIGGSAFTHKIYKDGVKLKANNAELEEQKIEIEAKRTALEENNIVLEEQKVELEAGKAAIEQKSKELQTTVDQLVTEKQKTETERAQKEEEQKLREQAQKAKIQEMEMREEERQAKLKERKLREQESAAKETAVKERKRVSRESAPEFVKKARALAAEFKWDEAVAIAKKALELDDLLSDGWYLMGWLHFGNTDFEASVEALSKSSEDGAKELKKIAQENLTKVAFGSEGKLSAFELHDLSEVLKGQKDFVLGDRLYQLTLGFEKEILAKLNKIKYDLKRGNIDLTDIRYQYTFDENEIAVDLSNNPELRNIRPLEGIPLTHLDLRSTSVDDVRSLSGMPLRILHISANQSSDNSDILRELPLTELHVHGVPTQDYRFVKDLPNARLHLHLYEFGGPKYYELAFLRFVPVESMTLHLHGNDFNDLMFLVDIPFTRLVLEDTAVKDLAPLRYHQLTYLDIRNSEIKNLKNLEKMPLTYLALDGTAVKDLSVLKGKNLSYLSIMDTEVRDLAPLKGLPLKHLNISGTEITDFSTLRGLPVEELFINRLPIIDFRFLTGMKLKKLHMRDTYANNIFMVRDMPLKELDISGTRVTNLKALARKQLTNLSISNTQITDLSVLKGMPLRYLDISDTEIFDISIIEGMHLTYLSLSGTNVESLDPLKGMPLKSLSLRGCTQLKDVYALNDCENLYKLILPEQVTTIHFLQRFSQLEYIAYSGNLEQLDQTTAQFWSKHGNN